MTKIETGVIVTISLALISGVFFAGMLNGRVSALEKDKDFRQIIESKNEAIEEIGKVTDASTKQLSAARKEAEDALSSGSERLKKLEGFAFKTREPGSSIEAKGSQVWGVWKGAVYCSEGQYVCGIEQKVEASQGDGDDTGVNGVRIFCCPL